MLHLLKWMEPFHPAVLQGWNAVLLPNMKKKQSRGSDVDVAKQLFFVSIHLLINI